MRGCWPALAATAAAMPARHLSPGARRDLVLRPMPDRARDDAAIITSGKTLKMTNDPWAHRGPPFEIDTDGDDTRDELIAFLQCVQRQDHATICDVQTGLQNTATVLMGNRAMEHRTIAAYPITAAATASRR